MEHTDDTQMPGANDQPEAHEDAGETLPRPPGIMPYALKQGLILGLIYVLISVIVYALGPGAVLAWETQMGSSLMLVLSLGFVIFMGLRFRKARQGGVSLSEGWMYSYVVFNGGLLLSLLWNLLLSTVIDPDIGNKMVNEAIAQHPVMAQDAAAEASTRHEMGLFFKPQGLLMKWLIGLGGYALLSLLSGLIIRRKQVSS